MADERWPRLTPERRGYMERMCVGTMAPIVAVQHISQLLDEVTALMEERDAAVNQAADLTRQLADERAARLAAEAEVARLTNVADAAEDFIDNGPPRAKAMYTDGEKWTLTCCDERQDRGHREGCLWEILESTLEVAASPATPAGWR